MENEKTQLAVSNLDSKGEVSINFFENEANFNLGQRMAKVFATSNLVPPQYQNNIGNCMIGLNMASRMKADPLMVYQNLVVVHGTPTFEAKFAIACFNATGKYTPIRYQEIGEEGKDSYGMYAYCIDKATGDVLKGPKITIKLTKDEGWYARNTKWKTIPDLMLRYRAASWLIRTTDPGVMLGFQTKEEVEDVDYVELPTGKLASDNAPEDDLNIDAAPTDDAPEKPAEEVPKEAENEKTPANGANSQDNSADDKLSTDAEKMQNSPNKALQNANHGEEVKTADKKPMGKQPTPDLFK